MTKKIQNREVGMEYTFSYEECKEEVDGWNSNRYHPRRFDLVFLQIQDSEKVVEGWWTGTGWYGARLQPSEKVIRWKRKMEQLSEKYG